MKDSLTRVSQIKQHPVAIAVLLDVWFYQKRFRSEICKDISSGETSTVIDALDRAGFIRPNPHREVTDIKYVLTTKGKFLVNELKEENPKKFSELEKQKKDLSARVENVST